jgi:polyribonucleotide nucleotidyltransferase
VSFSCFVSYVSQVERVVHCHTLFDETDVILYSSSCLQANLKLLNEKIDSRLKRAPKRPGASADVLQSRIAELEHRREHTSMSLVEEKRLIQDISSLRQQKGSISEYATFQAEQDALREERNSVRESLDKISQTVRELREGVRKLEVLERVRASNPGRVVNPMEIVVGEVKIAEEHISSLIGRKGASLREIEAAAGVALDLDQSKDGGDAIVKITGLESGIAKAEQLINAIATQIEHTVSASTGMLSYLLGQGGANIKSMETEFNVRLRVDKGASALIARGDSANVKAFEAALKKIESESRVLEVDSRTLPAVIGKGGENLKKLRDATGVEIHVTSASEEAKASSTPSIATLTVYGPPSAVSLASTALGALISTFMEHDLIIQVPKDSISWLVGKGGERIQAWQKEAGVFAKILRDEDALKAGAVTGAAVALRGTASVLPTAKQSFSHLLEEYHRSNVMMVISSAQARALIGHAGAGVKKLRADLGVEISIDEVGLPEKAQADDRKRVNRAEELGLKPGHAALFISGEPSKVLAATNTLKSLLSDHKEVKHSISQAVISALVNKKGELVSALQKETGASIDIVRPTADDSTGSGAIVITGSSSAVSSVEGRLFEIMASHQERSVHIADVGIIPELVGKSGSNIKAFMESIPGLASMDVDKENLKIVLVGTRTAIGDAATKLQVSMAKWASEHASITIDPLLMTSLIGKGGATIKALQEETGASINVDSKTGLIQLSGPVEALVKAKERIIALTHLDKPAETIKVDVETVGAVIGKSGGNIRKIEEAHGVSISADSGNGTITIRGDIAGINAAKAVIKKTVREARRKEASVEVPQSRLGAVIGPKGARVKAIEASTHTSIDLPRDREAPKVSISIRGSDVGLKKASAVLNAMGSGKSVRIISRPPTVLRDLHHGEGQKFIQGLSKEHLKVTLFDAEPLDPEDAADPTYTASLTGLLLVVASDESSASNAALSVEKFLSSRNPAGYSAMEENVLVLDELLSEDSSAVTLASILEATGVHGSADRDSGYIALWGPSSALQKAKAEITKVKSSVASRSASIPIENWMTPLIIGKKGADISKLRSQIKPCKVEIEEKSSKSTASSDNHGLRVTRSYADASSNLVVSGPTAESVANAKKIVEDVVNALSSRRAYVIVPVNGFSALIGKAGAGVKLLQEKTGASFDFDRDRGVVMVRADSSESVEGAVSAILARASEEGMEARRLESDEALPPSSFTASVRGISSDEASTLIGKGGSTISALESESGCVINVKRDANSSEVTIRGHSVDDVEDAIAAISKTLASVSVSTQPVVAVAVEVDEEDDEVEEPPKEPGTKSWATVGLQVEQKLSRRARKAANAALNASNASAPTTHAPQESAVSVKELPKEPVVAIPVAAPVAPVIFHEPVIAEKVVEADPIISIDPALQQRKLSMMTNVPVPVVAAPAPQSADEILAMLLGPQYKAKLAPSIAVGSLPPTPRMVSMTGGPLGSPLIPGTQPMAAATGITPTALFAANNPPVRKMSSGQSPSVRGPPPGLTKPAQPQAAAAGSKMAWGSKPPGISSPSKSQKDDSAFPSLNQRK